MPIVTISRGSHSMGKRVAEVVAEKLGYECLSRDVLLEASDQFNIPEIKLNEAISDAPSILERITHGKQRYVAYIQSALTRHVCKDNVVYHGLAGHVLLRNVSHVLKVRIIAERALRISLGMKRENLSERAASAWLTKIDRARRKWTKSLYGVDPGDPELYDLQLKIPKYEVDDAADLICRSVALEQFQRTEESQHEMTDLALACAVKAALVSKYPNVFVASRYGNVLLYCGPGDRQARRLRTVAADLAANIEGINNIEVHAGVAPPQSAV